jgi:hypothetical protein
MYVGIYKLIENVNKNNFLLFLLLLFIQFIYYTKLKNQQAK